MATELIVGFNGGEVSRNIESRIDLPLYKRSCSVLENFDVLPEGGVRNRSGTKFIAKTAGTTVAGDAPAYLLSFSYSDDYSYIFEFGDEYCKIWNNQTETVVDTLVTPYALADTQNIQFARSYDVMWLVHPDYPEQTITRTAVDAFNIALTEYDFPPMVDQNITATTITPSARTGAGITLTASTNTFLAGHEGSFWQLKQKRLASNIVGGIEYGSSISDTATTIPASNSGWFYVSSSHYRIETDNTWYGRIAIEQTLDGGTTVEEIVMLGDTTGITVAASAQNHIYESVNRAPVGAAIRLVWTGVTGNLDINISTKDSYIYGLAEITGYTSATVVTATLLGDLYDTGAITLWSEGAFSDVNGYPRTIALFEERRWLSGTYNEPNMVWGSQTDNFYQYFTGTLDDEAIRRAPPVNGLSSFLIAKDQLILGTTNEIVLITGLVSSQGLTPENFKFSVQTGDGSDYQQCELANDTILYVQKGRKKLRELLFSDVNQTHITNDLSSLAKHIMKEGANTIALQKLPDQRLLAILDDGELGLLAYERAEEVVAWHRYVTDGNYKSVAVTLDGDEDSVWYCIQRDGGYYIEKQKTREFPNQDYWFVDSGVSVDNGSSVTPTSIVVGAAPDYKITVTKTDHGLSDGNFIRFENIVGFDYLEAKSFQVADKDANTFVLKDVNGNYIDASEGDFPDYIDASGAGVSYMDGRYVHTTEQYDGADIYRLTDDIFLRGGDIGKWMFRDEVGINSITAYQHPTNSDKVPPLTGYTNIKAGYSPAPTLSYPSITGTYIEVSTSLSGLDHLEGETVQVMADGLYKGEMVVSSGAITLDAPAGTILAGLGYTSIVSPLPIDLISQYGVTSGHQKTISDAVIKLKDSIGGQYGTDLNHMEMIDYRDFDDLVGTIEGERNDDIQVYSMDTWDDVKRIYVQQVIPFPLEVLSISMNVETKGR